MVAGVAVAAVAAAGFVSTTDTWAAAAGLPAASLKHPPRDDEDADWDGAPCALGDEDDEDRNIRRIPRILRSIAPPRKLRKESTPPDGDADDSRTAAEIADGSSGGRCYRSWRSPRRSKVYNCSGCTPRWEETWGRPWRKWWLSDDFQPAADADDGDDIHQRRTDSSGRNSYSWGTFSRKTHARARQFGKNLKTTSHFAIPPSYLTLRISSSDSMHHFILIFIILTSWHCTALRCGPSSTPRRLLRKGVTFSRKEEKERKKEREKKRKEMERAGLQRAQDSRWTAAYSLFSFRHFRDPPRPRSLLPAHRSPITIPRDHKTDQSELFLARDHDG